MTTSPRSALERLTRALSFQPDAPDERMFGVSAGDLRALLSLLEWRPISEARQAPGERILFADASGHVGICWWEPENEGAGKPAGWTSDACIDFGGFEAPARFLPLPPAPQEDNAHG